MRKWKFAILFVLVLCLTVGMLVACDQTGGNSGTPTIPTNPDGSQTEDSYTTMSGSDAWALFREAASAANAPTGNYVYADSVIYLDYIKDATGYLYAVKVQADIDLANDVNSELLLELWQANDDGDLAKMLVGLYYYDSTLVYDCTGLKEGAKVVKTDNINITAIEATLREMFNGSSLANFLLNNLLTFDTGVVGTVEGLVTALLGDSRLITNSDGTQRLEMPLSLTSIIGSLLSGVLVPGPDGLISDDIAELIYDILGIDLYMFEALVPENVSVYLIADLKDGADGGKVLSGMSVDVGVDFNTYDTSLEEDYGIIESSVDLSIGATTIDKLTAPTLDVVGYLTAPKAAEGELESAGGRGIESVESLDDYSILTLDVTLSLGVALNACSISASDIMGAFGSLITGLIPGGSITEDIQQILDKEINIEDALHELNIHISGGIDMFDNAGTNLLIEITGEDVYNDVRASIGYVGADDALYVDLSGILGTGKFVVDEIDLNGVLSDLIQNQLIPLVKDGLASVGLLPDAADTEEGDDESSVTDEQKEAVETVGELIANGTVLQVYGGSASGEPITDVIGLVRAIFANIDVDMANNIFNIQAITATLTQEILDYIWSLAFTGNLEGATIPIVGDVVLEYRNNGFATTKDIELNVDLGNVLTGDVIAGLTVGIEAQFGSVINESYFNERLAAFSAGRQNGDYITLASFGDLFDEQGNFALDPETLLAGIQSVGIGLRADINISALEGGLADIYYEQANEFLIAVLAEFEQSFGGSATLVLQAEVADVSALIAALSVPEGQQVDIGAVLPALNIYLALEIADGSAPLRVWLVDGVIYLATSEKLLNGLALQVDIKPFLTSAGGANEALSADGTGSGNTGTGSAVTIPAELLAIITAADITVGDLYIDVALGSGLLATLLNLIGVEGIKINESGSDETLGLDAGISIELNDGLQIAGGDTSEGLSIGIVLGVGENFDFTVDLGGVNAVVNGGSYIESVPDDVEFVDFFNEPYVNLSLEFGLGALIAGGSISLGDDVGSIDFPEGLDVDLTLSLNANLDLGTLLAEFTGVVPEGENRTQLALQLKNGDEVLLAAYYSAGTLYVDAGALIGARVSTDLDIMALLASVIAGSDSGGEGGEAVTTADINAEDYSVGVFEFLMKVTSTGFSVEVAKGLTSVINDLIGMDLGEISAVLSLDWTNIVKDEDGGYLLAGEVKVGDMATVNISLSGLGLGIGEGIFDNSVLPAEFDSEDYKNIGSLLDENNQFSAAGLELDSVYVELSGTLDLSADANTAGDWNVGDWINNFLEGDATVADNVKSLIQKLVLSFAIDRSVSTSLEFTLKALLRFGDDMTDVGYILSHSDIALEIRESGKTENLLAVYIIADEATGKSTLYIASDAGGLIGGGIAVPDIDLGSLFTANTDTPAEGEGTQNQALSAADGETETTDGTDNILDTILGIINRIYMTDSELEVGLGANFLVSLLNMLLPGYELNADNFVQLNPENSFLSLFYGLGEGGRREIGIDLSLGVDPFTVALGLGGLKVAINDDSNAIEPSVPEGYGGVDDYYKNIFAEDGVISLEATVGLELSFGDTAALEDGKLPLGDMLSAIMGNLALELGIEISDDLRLAVDVYLGANIMFGDAENTEIALQIKDAISSDVILAVYLKGSAMYVDMGKLSDKDFVIENTGIISTVIEKVSGLLAGVEDNGTEGASEAVTASDVTAQADEEDMLDIVFEIAEGHLALNVTERVILGIIGAVAGTDVDIDSIFEALNLGAEVSVDVDFEAPSVSIDIDTNYASVGVSIDKPYITNSKSDNVSGIIDKAIAEGNFQSYTASSVARFGLNLSVRYSADATYQEVDNPEEYPVTDRYTQLPDGAFVQDNEGTFVRAGYSLSDIIDALLDMPAIGDALGNVGNETLQAIVDVLVARLGIELYLDDPISDNLQINIEGLLDLEALGLSGILGDFTIPKLDTLTILNALQVGIEIIFNPETGSTADVAIYLMNGDIYVDLERLGGPKISARLFDILAAMDVRPFGEGGSEAVTADENSGDGSGSTSEGVDINAILNALVRTIVLREGGFAQAGTDGYYNILQSGVGLDLMLPSNLIGNIVSLIVGNDEEYSFDDFILNEEQSCVSLVLGGGNIVIEVAAESDKGFDIEISTQAGIVIDVATQDDTLLSAREISTYTDVTDLVFSIINLVNGGTIEGGGFGSQRVTFSLSGMARFESDGEGSYDLGSLLADYLGDIILELNTQEAFSDGIAFRLSVAADLGAINFAALTGETPDWDAFLNGVDANGNPITDLNTIEVALELLNIDDAGNIEQDNVLGGIYISNGKLYLDGTDIFDVVENYSYVSNFLQFVIEAAQLSASADVTTGESGGASSQALTAAVTASEGSTSARDALLELIYSDTAMQIVLTKSIISAVLATLVPDLGGIADIFDNFDVTLGAEIGRIDYESVYDVFYEATAADDGEYVAVTEKDSITGFRPATADDVGVQRYSLTLVEAESELGGTYYVKEADGTFTAAVAGHRYSHYETVNYAESDIGSLVKIIGEDRYFDMSRTAFYSRIGDSDDYILVTDIDSAAKDNLYVREGSNHYQLEYKVEGETAELKTYVRQFGYVRDAEGEFYRVYTPHTAISDFYLTLGAHVGTMNVGLELGGIEIEFGGTDSLVPDYVTAGKTKTPAAYDGQGKAYTYDENTGVYTEVEAQEGGEYYYDVPLMPFYDSVVTVGMSVEFELSITEGQIDVGQIFAGILGDLDGIVIEIPETNKGYSSAHLRLDLSLMLDMQDLPGSEIAVELYNLSSEAGAEVKWLAAYYLDGMLYIDLSFFNMPKLAVPMTEISDFIEDMLGDLLNTSIYDDVEVSGGSSSEAITADDTDADEQVDDSLTSEDKVASLLISERRLALSVGNAFMRYLLENITIGGDPLGSLVYEDLLGSLDVTIDLSDGVDVALDVALMLSGDRYEYAETTVETTEDRYYTFKAEDDSHKADAAGLFVEEDGAFRPATKQDAEAVKYVRYEAVHTEEGSWTFYEYKKAADGEYVYDAATRAYLPADAETDENAARYTRNAVDLGGGQAIFRYVKGAEANPNAYNTELNLYVGVNNIDMYFTEQREYSLTADELKEYYNFNSVDTVSLSETISLDLLFDVGSEIDLASLFEYLFPDSTYDFDTVIAAIGEGDQKDEILRGLELTVSLEFKLGAFINYLRSLDALYELGSLDENGVFTALAELPEELDLVTFIQLVMSLVGAKAVPNADGSIYYTDDNVDDLFGLEDFLNFVNASVVLSTSSNDGTPDHTMLGVYLSLGDADGVKYDAKKHEGQQRYSHYFASALGDYGYVDGDYVLISEIEDYNEAVHGRYSYDASFLYPDENGKFVRENAGLYVDLSYFGQPGVYVNLTELMDFIGGMMGQEVSLDGIGASEAITAAGDDSSVFPVDLGDILGGGINLSDSLPLLSQEIAAYVQAFLYGIRITSTYIRVFLQADFIDSLIDLLDTDPSLDFGDFEQSYIGINVDVNNYLYAGLNTATAEQIEFADTRFAIEDTGADGDGMYYKTDAGYYELRSDMTAQEEENYDGSYYNITPIETYLNVNGEYVLASEASNTDWLRAERYDAEGAVAAGNAALEGTYKFYVAADSEYAGEDTDGNGYAEFAVADDIYVVYPSDEQKPFIEANIYLWNHNISLGINMPTTSGAEYSYISREEAGEDAADYSFDYEKVDRLLYVPYVSEQGGLDIGSVYYLYYRGEYYPIKIAEDATSADEAARSGVYSYEDGDYKAVTSSSWGAFCENPANGDYYLFIHVESQLFSIFEPITESDIYEAHDFGDDYRYVGKGKGDYARLGTTSLVSVPEFHVNFDSNVENYDTLKDTYHVDDTGNLVAGSSGDPEKDYDKDDVHFVYDEATGTFMSVADYLAANSLDSLPEGTRVYDSEYINYLDTGDLYYLNVVIRGEIFLGQHVEYLTEDEWTSANLGELPEDKYVLVRGKYVPYDKDNTTHNGLTKYYAYANSSSAVSEVLGAILGDMDALFTVADGYQARLPFEIRATVKLDYANETDYNSLYVAGLELAVDVWRTEASDDTLSHVLGLYYMSDVWNIGDNDITNDVINSSALYLDLTWLLGDGAKFKVDLSDYPLEDLLNDNIDLGSIFGGGASEAITAADETDLGDTNKATVLLNVFSRSIALKASAGLIKLLVGLIAPDMSATLEEMLPNMSIFAQIDAAPYDLTIGATLYDEEGTGLLDLGLTLNLFNTDDASEGLQLSFGSLEDYAELSAAQLAAKSKDYIYYYGLFTRNDDVAGDDYYIKDGTEKGYVHISEATEEQIAAAGDAKFVFNDDIAYDLFKDSSARTSYPASERYAEVPAGYVALDGAEQYNWAKDKVTLYYFRYSLTGSGRMIAISGNDVSSITNSERFLSAYGIAGQDGYAKLYVSAEDASTATDEGLFDAETIAGSENVQYVLDANGAHKQTTVFTDYKTLLSLNIDKLIEQLGNKDESTDTTSAILDMLVGGLQDAGLETVEIGGTLSLDLTFRDAINWTRQMSRLMETDSSTDTYFEMLLASLAMNSAEFVSAIGLDIKLALQIRLDGLIAMLPDLLSNDEIDTAALLGAILGGASIYLEIAIDTNFFGERIEGAQPIKIWLLVDENLGADVYIYAPDLGRVIGSAVYNEGSDEAVLGDLFADGLKLEGMLNLGELLSGITGGSGASEAVTAADSSFVIDIGDATTGLIPEDIWGVLNLLVGQALFAGDMISVGITENLLAGLIEALVPEFPEEDLELLPTFTVTSGADTSGVNLLFGDGSLALQVQLGIRGGFDDFATVKEVYDALKGVGADTVYGINDDNLDEFIGTVRVTATETDDGTTYAEGDNVVLSTKDYALAAFASPEEIWLGTRYEMSVANGELVFTAISYKDSYVTSGAFTQSATGAYVLVNAEDDLSSYEGEGSKVNYTDKFMPLANYLKLTGKTADEVETSRRYSLDASKIVGEYVKLGDVTIALELGDLGVTLNEEFSEPVPTATDVEFQDVLKASIRLSTSIDIGFHGTSLADIDLGALADLIFGIDAIKTALGVELTNNSLDVSVTGELGNADRAYFNVRLDAWFDLRGGLQVRLTVGRYDETETGAVELTTVIGVVLADDTLFADLSGLLGTGVKGYISNLGVEELLFEALGGVLNTSAFEATTATISDTENMTLHDYAYLAVMINPGYFSLQLTLATIQAILAKVSADNPDLNLGDIELPDLGDIMIESNGSAEDGAWLSLNAKLSENFSASIDIGHLYLGTEALYDTTIPVLDAAGLPTDESISVTGTEGEIKFTTKVVDDNTVDIATLPEEGEGEYYTYLYDVASGELNPNLNVSASAALSLTMTSEGLVSPDKGDSNTWGGLGSYEEAKAKYDSSLAGWVIDLVTGMLGATSIFVTPYDRDNEAEYNAYGGPIYVLGDDGVTYEEIGKVASDGNGYYALDKEEGTYADTPTAWEDGKQYYRTTIVEATFAANEVNLIISLEADLNIGAIVTYGIGGILFSDFRVSVELGAPFDSTVLEVYYLGSSRLSSAANNNIYTLVEDVEAGNLGAFNDAIYINASGLGLGWIKFQGLAGIFGANIGQIYDNDALTAYADTAADETDTGAEEGTASEGEALPSASVSLGINVAENYLGIGIDRNLIQTVFGLLGDSLDFELPDVQSLNLGLTLGTTGLNSVTIESQLDPAGTGAIVTLSDLQVSLSPFVDVDSLINEVKTGYGGLTYSQTAGTMTLITNILDGLNASLGISIDKQGQMIVNSTGTGHIDHVAVVTKANSKGSFKLTGMSQYVSEGPSGTMGSVPDGYMLVLNGNATHTESYRDNEMRLSIYFGNNSLWMGGINLGGGSAGLIQTLLGILNGWELGSLFDLPGLLGGLAYSDADNSSWNTENPVATTASNGQPEASYTEESSAETAADVIPDIPDPDDRAAWTNSNNAYSGRVDDFYKVDVSTDAEGNPVYTSTYSYALQLNNLVEKVTVNLFNSNGYQPYLSNMTDLTGAPVSDTDASLISVKAELSKQGYNELMIYVYTMLLSLIHGDSDVNANWADYFHYDADTALARHGYQHDAGIADNNDYYYTYTISNLFRELDSIQGNSAAATKARVDLLTPYVKTLPFALLNWLVHDMAGISRDALRAIGLVGGTLDMTLFPSLGNITTLVATALPPFADMGDDSMPNPSINIYIDLAPEKSMYGIDREIVPGIQAIELMVNAEKYGGGRNLRQGDVTGEIFTDGSSSGNLNFDNAYVLAINPLNLIQSGSENKGLVSFLEADHLNSLSFSSGTQLTSDQLTQLRDGNTYITVSDIGSKAAQLHGISRAEGNLNASFLTSNLPTSANVQLVSPNNPHDVTVIWDASAIDLSAPHSFVDEDENGYCDNCGLEKGDATLGAHGTQRLAGFVYGYALNLVVAKIPVYVTNDFTATEVSPVGSNDPSFSIDMSSAGNVKLPDLVKIKFTSEGATSGTNVSYIFGTQRFDEAGNAQYAVLRNASGNYQFKVTDANGNVTYSYHELGISSTETTTYELALYPAYVAYTQEGNTVTSGETTYYVIDSASVNNMPVGTFSWDEFSYGWDGGAAEDDAAKVKHTVGLSYQWGFAETQRTSTTVYVVNNEVTVDGNTLYANNTGSTTTQENAFNFSNWSNLKEKLSGYMDAGESWQKALNDYLDDTLIGVFSNNNEIEIRGFNTSALDGVTVGSEVNVAITMYVGKYYIWRQYNGTTPANGMLGDLGIMIDGVWDTLTSSNYADEHKNISNEIATNGYAVVAQPVYVTFTIGAEEGFTFDDAVQGGGTGGGTDEGGEQGGEITTESVDTFAFSDGSSTSVTADGVQTYEITSSAQLYGMMPESGVIVDGDTGRTRKAAFDWNGFAYDTSASVNVALLTATSGGTRIETDVIVTLADNADVNAGVGALEATAGYVTGIADASMRAMVIDPFEYPTFAAYLEAKGYENGDEITVYTTDSPSVPVRATVVAWSDTFENSSAMPLAGGRYDDHCIIVEIGGVQYSVNVPVIVLERNIAASELLLNEGFELVNEYNRLNSTIRRYVGEGQVVEVTYSRETYLPTAITVYNLYAFADNNPFTGQIRITFENGGEQVDYAFDYVSAQKDGGDAYTDEYVDVDGIEIVRKNASSSDARIYNYSVAGGIQTGSVTVTFNAVRITQNNMDSAVAYGDLGGTAKGTYEPFAPYKNMTLASGGEILSTPYGTQGSNLSSYITFYIDGRYVASAGFDAADYPGYTVLKDGDVPREYVRGSGTSYTLVTGDTTAATYYFIYGAKDKLKTSELTWNHSGISYNYNGGLRRTSASVNANGITGTVTVPIWIVSGRIKSVDALYFNEDGQDGLLAVGSTLSVDPFAGIDLTALAAEGSEHYKYFPSSVDVTTTDGCKISGLGVTWSNLGSIRNTYRGGVYSARLTVPAVTSEGGATSYVAAQGFTVDSFVHVESRAAVDGTLTPNNGTLPTVGYADQGTATSYIDPYEFDLSAFRTAVEAITEVSVYISGISERVTFGVTGTDSAASGYTLVWSFAGMAVNYLGGRVALIAQLTGPDGSTQNYEIDYLVTRKVVSRIYATKGLSDRDKPAEGEKINANTLWFTFGTDPDAVGFGTVNDGDSKKAYYSNGTYVIDPFIPSTQSLPAGWNVTFALFNPVLEGGVVTGWTDEGTEEQSYSYITTIMPSTAAVTADVANSADGKPNAGDATMQIDGGQRLRIPVSIKGNGATDNVSVDDDARTLPSRTAGGSNVVWYGTMTVRYNLDASNNYCEAVYNVIFTSPDGEDIVLSGQAGRYVEYNLTAYVGAVIDVSGNVLDWENDVPAARISSVTISSKVDNSGVTQWGSQYDTDK